MSAAFLGRHQRSGSATLVSSPLDTNNVIVGAAAAAAAAAAGHGDDYAQQVVIPLPFEPSLQLQFLLCSLCCLDSSFFDSCLILLYDPR